MKIYKTDTELKKAIQETYPELTGAGKNILRWEVILRAHGSSLEKVTDKMKVKGSPFLKLPSRD